MPDAFNSIEAVLLCFIAAFGLSYAGMRLLWTGVGAGGVLRGFVLAAPVVALSVLFSLVGQPGAAIAVCLAAAVLMLTLGTGVAATGRGEDLNYESATPTAIRFVLPLAAAACAAGFNGRLTLVHLLVLAVVGGMTAWSALPLVSAGGVWNAGKIVTAAVLLATAVGLIALAGRQFQTLAGAAVVTPLVVLLAAPALLLPLMGLLSTETAMSHFASAGDTIAGFVIATVGVAMPLSLGTGLLRMAVVQRFLPGWPKHVPMMPVATWRIDSLLLLTVAALLSPGVAGKLRLGKVEGVFLIALYLAYAAVASRTGLGT